MASFKELASKKVGGIPVLYLAGAFVAILAIVAWKMKPSVDVSDPSEPVSETDGGAIDTDGDPDYSALTPTGTVTVVNPPVADTESTKQTNEDWERAAVDYLVESNQATPGVAQTAIHKYLEGSELTYEQGQLRDSAIRKLKTPPEPLVEIGTTGTAPAQRQFSNFPGKHTVKGSNDDGLTKLAALYYGRSETPYTTLLTAANPSLPRYGKYNVGTVVTIPAYTEPKYYVAGSQDAKTIAAKSSISTTSLSLLNPGMVFPVKRGTRVRVK
jgi:hypothetical protein